jgi:2-amino-4-hydroxy-6-hydroxymethyldihydropteridine diphosphokinase
MVRAFIGVGSNLDPGENTYAALRALARHAGVVGVSTFYRTAAIDRPHDPAFVNGVVAIETGLPPMELKWRVLRAIEAELGRQRGADAYAPRTLDLDLLLYGREVHRSPRLSVPDPDLERRPFLAWPLVELAPALVLPDGRPLRNVAERLPRGTMRALPELTRRLRAEHEASGDHGA